MSVYVDGMRLAAQVRRLAPRWSHLMADSSEELYALATRRGPRHSRAQHEATGKERYDVTGSKQPAEIALGVSPIHTGSHEWCAVTARNRATRTIRSVR